MGRTKKEREDILSDEEYALQYEDTSAVLSCVLEEEGVDDMQLASAPHPNAATLQATSTSKPSPPECKEPRIGLRGVLSVASCAGFLQKLQDMLKSIEDEKHVMHSQWFDFHTSNEQTMEHILRRGKRARKALD
jgi:hypothetical protein